jgi:hypothetical protein
MKTKILVAIVAAVVVDYTAPAQTNLTLVDTTTPHTNATWSTGSTISALSKGWTNVSYTTTNPAAVYYGDSAPTAYGKINNSLTYLNSQQISNATKLAQVAASNLVFSLMITNLNGSNLMNGTVSSNKFDSATMTWLGSLGGGGGGSTMNYDSGNITSDGSGNINAVGFKGSLIDYVSSAGSSGNYAKANGDGTWQWEPWPATLNYDSANITSDGSGNLTATTVKSGLTDSGYSTGTYGYTAVAMGDGTWTWMAGVTITNIITNTITAYAFSNQFLSSALLTTFSTNNITWGTSNFLARVNGLFSYTLNGGMLGGGGLAPGTNVDIRLTGSYSGTNAWFVVTNGFKTTNTISIAATGAGGGLGNAALYVLDHPELEGRTNSFFGQYVRFSSPVDPSDAATKSYVDTAVANVKDGGFSSYSSNGLSHFVWSYQNRIVFDITSATTWIPLKGSSVDGSYTHILVDVYQTNLTAGYDFQSSTNLAITAGFTTFTNYTLSTNTGVVTFTVPIVTTEPQRFFRVISSIASGAAFNVPLTLNVGTLYPSNTWSLTTITSSIPNFGWWVGTSNGQALVSVGVSNGTVRIKQLAP